MPTSATGSSPASAASPRRPRQAGFTLIELLIVMAIIAVSVAVVSLALRDSDETRLAEEAERLVALLEMARSESRVTGTPVRWLPVSDSAEANFRFVGLSPLQKLPLRWLDTGTSAQVVAGVFVVLGPEAILPPQRVVLRLGAQQLELATDGLGPFAVATPEP